MEAVKQFEKEHETYSNVYETPTNRSVADNQARAEKTPTIAPKPITSQRSRNPFKKSSTLKSTPTNPLTHLTNKSVGFGSKDSTINA